MSGTTEDQDDKVLVPDGPDIEVEVVDDTPEADRERTRRPEGKQADIPEDQEIAGYAVDAQKRIQKMRYEFHEERRAKEEVERQNSEALRLLKHYQQEVTKLRGFARDRDKEALHGARTTIEQQIAAATRDLKEAFTSGDTDKFAEAQNKVNRLTVHSERLRMTQPMIPEEPEPEPQAPQENFGGMRGEARTVSEAAASPDAKAVAWGATNPWFGKDQVLTGMAYGIHAKLAEDGDIAIGSDLYYQTLDRELRRMAPQSFRDGDSSPRASTNGAQALANGGRVSSVGRSSASPGNRKVVRITASQAAVAKKLGISAEQYAAEVMKLGT
jgi:hypothetical protein